LPSVAPAPAQHGANALDAPPKSTRPVKHGFIYAGMQYAVVGLLKIGVGVLALATAFNLACSAAICAAVFVAGTLPPPHSKPPAETILPQVVVLNPLPMPIV
jgi:hypothetical protein